MVIAKQTAIDALETCDVDCNKALIKGAPRSPPSRFSLSISIFLLIIKKSFEDEDFQVGFATNRRRQWQWK